jgi:hypothetical protein
MANVIKSIDAVNESTVVALACGCEAGTIISHDLVHSLGDDEITELVVRLGRRGLKLTSTDRGVEVANKRGARTEDAWWAWHDADASRWSPGENEHEATSDAERRCEAWVSGESDDGPSVEVVS